MITVADRVLIKKDYDRRYSVIEKRFDIELEKLELQLREECRNVTRVNTVGLYRLRAREIVDQHVQLSYDACRTAWKNQDGEDFFNAFILVCLGSILSKLYRSNLTQLFRSVEGDAWRKTLNGLEREWEAKIEIEASDARLEQPTTGIVAATPVIPAAVDAAHAAPIDMSTPVLPIKSKVVSSAKPSKNKSRSEKRSKAISDISASGVRGEEYCKVMDDRRMRPAGGWREQGWPGTYVAAWNSPSEADQIKWRDKISKEKTRHTRK